MLLVAVSSARFARWNLDIISTSSPFWAVCGGFCCSVQLGASMMKSSSSSRAPCKLVSFESNPRGRPSVLMAAHGADGGTGSARRRRERRLRSWLRHEQQSIAAVLATVTHHSFDKLGTVSGVLRNQKTATRGRERSTRRTSRLSSRRLLSRNLQPPSTTR